jgi:hypothetical protein
MRTSWWLASVAVCLGAGSCALGQGVNLNPLSPPSNGVNFTPFSGVSNGINLNPFALNNSSAAPPSGASQATFASPGRTLAGPSKLFNLLPTGLGSFSNSHPIGFSIFPTQTDQYLAQFGYQKLR